MVLPLFSLRLLWSQTDPTARAEQLLSQMTPEEKIGQLNQLFYFAQPPAGLTAEAVNYENEIRKGHIGSLLFVTDPKQINHFQRIAMKEQRLHIPILFGFDVIHGFDTEFPVPIAMAASWDPSAAEAAQAIAAQEAKQAGVRWTFAPMLDIARDPRWGRISEGAGEDPYLGAAFAAAQVKGFQGEPGKPHEFIATLKHFAGYGAAEGGRDYDAAFIPEDLLRNVYLVPFLAGVRAGARSVMSAYMDLNDVPAAGNKYLLQDILRGEWKFDGFVVSDANAVGDLATHGFAKDFRDAALRAARAGLNLDMNSQAYLKNIGGLLKDGSLSMGELDALVKPLLIAKFKLGLFDNPYADEASDRHAKMLAAHRQTAREVAQKSMVLLRNEGHLLPISKSVQRIAVIGPLGNNKFDMNGPWSLTADSRESTTVVEGLKAKLPQAEIEYESGVQISKTFPSMFEGFLGPPPEPTWTAEEAANHLRAAVELASKADVVIVAVGEHSLMDFEYSSRASLTLPGQQLELLQKVSATGKPVVLLLMSTRPLDMAWASEHVPAILDCYFGGTEAGNAIADLLTGDAVPGGKLPVTWPRSVGQVPIFYAHNTSHVPYDSKNFASRYWDLPTSPQYPFGFGLSYSSFAYSNLTVDKPISARNETVSVHVDLKNTGNVDADEIAQFYIHQRYGSASRPVRELKGFQRVHLKAGETKSLMFSFGPAERRYWSSSVRDFVVEPSIFDLWVGGDSAASLHQAIEIHE